MDEKRRERKQNHLLNENPFGWFKKGDEEEKSQIHLHEQRFGKMEPRSF